MIFSVGTITARFQLRPEWLDALCGAAATQIGDFEEVEISQALLGIKKAGLLGPNAYALADALQARA